MHVAAVSVSKLVGWRAGRQVIVGEGNGRFPLLMLMSNVWCFSRIDGLRKAW